MYKPTLQPTREVVGRFATLSPTWAWMPKKPVIHEAVQETVVVSPGSTSFVSPYFADRTVNDYPKVLTNIHTLYWFIEGNCQGKTVAWLKDEPWRRHPAMYEEDRFEHYLNGPNDAEKLLACVNLMLWHGDQKIWGEPCYTGLLETIETPLGHPENHGLVIDLQGRKLDENAAWEIEDACHERGLSCTDWFAPGPLWKRFAPVAAALGDGTRHEEFHLWARDSDSPLFNPNYTPGTAIMVGLTNRPWGALFPISFHHLLPVLRFTTNNGFPVWALPGVGVMMNRRDSVIVKNIGMGRP